MRYGAAICLWTACWLASLNGVAAAQEARKPLDAEDLDRAVQLLVHRDSNIRESAQSQLLLHAEQAMPLLMAELADAPDSKRAVAAAIVLANMRKIKREAEPQIVDHWPIVKPLAAMLLETRRPLEPWRWYLAAFLAVTISDEEGMADSRGLEVLKLGLLRGLRSHQPMKRYAAVQAAFRLKDPRAIGPLWTILHSHHQAPQGVDMTVLTGYWFELGFTNALGAYAPIKPEYDPDKKELQIRGGLQYFDWDEYGPPIDYVRAGGSLNALDEDAEQKKPKGRAFFVWEKFLVMAALDRMDADWCGLEAAAYRLAHTDNLWVKRDAARILLAMYENERPIDQSRLSRLLLELLRAQDYEMQMFVIRQLRELKRDRVDSRAIAAAMLSAMQDEDFDIRQEAALTLLRVGPQSEEISEAVLELIAVQRFAQEGLVRRLGGRIGGTSVRMLTAIKDLEAEWVEVYQPKKESNDDLQDSADPEKEKEDLEEIMPRE